MFKKITDPITFTFSENSNYGQERCKGKTLSGVVDKLLNGPCEQREQSLWSLTWCHEQVLKIIT